MRKEHLFTVNLIFNAVLAGVIGVALAAHFLGVEFAGKVFIIFSFIGLLPVLRNAALALSKKKLTIDLLASVALVFSFVAREWHSAAFICLMLACARIFSLWTDRKAQHILEHLLKYRPNYVKVQRGGQTLEIKTGQLAIGDLVVIEAGDRIPVDGIVVSGQAALNEATITGESELVSKKTGDPVLSSTLNESGSLLVKAEKVGKDSTVEKIIALITEASGKKSQSERISDKFTAWYIVITLLAALILFLFLRNVNLVLAILLVTCADDIAVAVPLGFTLAIAKAAKNGVLIKGGGVVENLARVRYFMADKTGTLTFGRPKISGIEIFGDLDEKDFLKLAGLAQVNSHHPLSKAVVHYLKERNIHVDSPDDFMESPGDGIIVKKNGDSIVAGNPGFVTRNGFTIEQSNVAKIEKAKDEGKSIVVYGKSNQTIGFISFEDEIRPFVKELLQRTRILGVRKWLILTGDNERVASRVAKELGIDDFKANLKPQDKLTIIEDFKKENEGVLAMMGDGVNDAAALALADVGFAMGTAGSDVAIEAADVALIKDKLEKVPQIIAFSQQAVRIIKHNFFLWGAINLIGLFLVFGGILNPMGAALYNFLTDFIPILNVFRIEFCYRTNKRQNI